MVVDSPALPAQVIDDGARPNRQDSESLPHVPDSRFPRTFPPLPSRDGSPAAGFAKPGVEVPLVASTRRDTGGNASTDVMPCLSAIISSWEVSAPSSTAILPTAMPY